MESGAPLADIERIYGDSFASFVRVAAGITGSREGGRDAVHDGFVSAVRGRATFRGEGTVEAWLWRIVVHAAQKQRAKSDPAYPLPVDESLASSNGGGDSELWLVRDAIAQLPERQRLVVFLRYYADLDYQAIAGVLEISSGTVGATLTAAHTSLRVRIKEGMTDG